MEVNLEVKAAKKQYAIALNEAKKTANKKRRELKKLFPNARIYTTKNGYSKQRFYLKNNSIQARLNKETIDFVRLNTNEFVNFYEMAEHYKEYEYIQNSVNAYTRGNIIIDCDDNDRGVSTLDALKRLDIKPYYQKIKDSNGHSQTAVFIYQYQIRDPNYKTFSYDEVYVSSPVNHKEQIECSRIYITVTQMLNIVCNGDIGFTGSNCQNPYCTNYGTTTWFKGEDTCRYHLLDLYKKLMDFYDLKSQEEANVFIKKVRAVNFYKKGLKKENTETNTNKNKIVFVEDSLEKDTTKLLDGKMSYVDFYDAHKKQVVQAEKAHNSINYHIYELCNQHFTFCKERDIVPTPTSLENWMVKTWNRGPEQFHGYTFSEYINRVRNNFKYIEKTHDLDKAAYTDIQRVLGFQIRNLNSFHTWLKVNSYRTRIYTNKMTRTEVAKKLDISVQTVSRMLVRSPYSFKFNYLMKCMEKVTKTHKLYVYLPLLKVAIKKLYKLSNICGKSPSELYDICKPNENTNKSVWDSLDDEPISLGLLGEEELGKTNNEDRDNKEHKQEINDNIERPIEVSKECPNRDILCVYNKKRKRNREDPYDNTPLEVYE